MMRIIHAAAAISVGAVASATAASAANNPFAPKVTRNTPRSSYVGSLMANARPTSNSKLGKKNKNRRLDEDGGDYAVDISSYSVRFEKCQYVKQYADERNEDIDTVLETKRFVIFRLCANGDCSSSGCEYDYGEYIVDMETYLESTLKHMEEEQENYCEACDECADGDDAAAYDDAVAADDAVAGDDANANGRARRRRLVDVDCSTCYTQCQNIANMEENGYVDAAEYVQGCEKVYENENNGKVYYAGPICANSGTRIKVGLFTDEDCYELDENAMVDQYLKNENGYNVKLSYHLLKQTFVSDDCVASCAAQGDDDDDADDDANGDDDAAAEVETAEVCGDLYEAAGKCETSHGFESGMDYSGSDYYDVQVSNEEAVCDFITSIQSEHYDMYGEVVVSGGNRHTVTASNGVQTTGGQKFALTFFVIGTVGLAAYAALLLQRIKGTRADLSALEGGAMA